MMSGRARTAIDGVAEAYLDDSAAFDLKSFHRRVLDIGSVGLDVLRDAVLEVDRSTGAL
jgi:uncharacterized protein (DUF885 family)